jgi:beta-N-acetylhexosaminidase
MMLSLALVQSAFCDDGAAAYRERAAAIAAALDNRQLAAQVILTGIDGKGSLAPAMAALLEEIPAGGIMLFRYNVDIEKKNIASFLQSVTERVGGIPPFMAIDHEGGWVHRFGAGVERLPAPFSYWERIEREGREAVLAAIEEDAARSGREIRALGITMNLAPVVEYLTGENTSFLEERSYGPDGEFVGQAAAAFIRGMGAAGVSCVAKHFPGNTGADPHKGRPLLGGDAETLGRMIEPFAALIRTAAPSGIMVSHAVVPAWDGERNASLSAEVMERRLRGELGFTGIVLGDDFSMGALAGSGFTPDEAAAEALIAGADMVMAWPMNIRSVHGSILKALETGRLSRERLEEAAARIIAEKLRYGIIK